jgi:putative ABC transport system permease protein
VTGAFYPGMDVTAAVDYASSVTYSFVDENTVMREYEPLEHALAEDITAKLREYPETGIFGVGTDAWAYATALPRALLSPQMREFLDGGIAIENDEYVLPVTLLSIDAENYARLCETAGVPYGSNILVNRKRVNMDGIRSEFEPFIWSGQTPTLELLLLPYNFEGQMKSVIYNDVTLEALEVPLHGVLGIGDVAEELLWFIRETSVGVITPTFAPPSYEWLANVADDEGFAAYARDILSVMLPPSEAYSVSTTSLAELNRALTDARNLILTFIYGFVGMLILVGLTNVISTISTNIRSRSREFAVLQSVGMTNGGLKKMLDLESILSSARSLCFGLPLGLGLSYLIYLGTIQTAYFPYTFPWLAVAQCVLGVFAITWVTMRYAASRLRGGNIHNIPSSSI